MIKRRLRTPLVDQLIAEWWLADKLGYEVATEVDCLDEQRKAKVVLSRHGRIIKNTYGPNRYTNDE